MRRLRSITSGAPTMASGCIWAEMIRASLCLVAFAALAPVLYVVRPRMTRGTLTAGQIAELVNHARRAGQWRETLTSDRQTGRQTT